jgi:hypothetical protein
VLVAAAALSVPLGPTVLVALVAAVAVQNETTSKPKTAQLTQAAVVAALMAPQA